MHESLEIYAIKLARMVLAGDENQREAAEKLAEHILRALMPIPAELMQPAPVVSKSAPVNVEIKRLFFPQYKDRILRIEQMSFAQPWLEKDWKAALGSRNVDARAASIRGLIVGYVVYERSREVTEIWNLAVHPQWRRRRVATQLMHHLCLRLLQKKYRLMRAEILETRTAALCFFRDIGFQFRWIIREACEDTGESSIVMERAVTDCEQFRMTAEQE